jgi:hypothetical protein
MKGTYFTRNPHSPDCIFRTNQQLEKFLLKETIINNSFPFLFYKNIVRFSSYMRTHYFLCGQIPHRHGGDVRWHWMLVDTLSWRGVILTHTKHNAIDLTQIHKKQYCIATEVSLKDRGYIYNSFQRFSLNSFLSPLYKIITLNLIYHLYGQKNLFYVAYNRNPVNYYSNRILLTSALLQKNFPLNTSESTKQIDFLNYGAKSLIICNNQPFSANFDWLKTNSSSLTMQMLMKSSCLTHYSPSQQQTDYKTLFDLLIVNKWNISVEDHLPSNVICDKFILGSVELNKLDNYHSIVYNPTITENVEDVFYFISRCVILQEQKGADEELLFFEEIRFYKSVQIDATIWHYPSNSQLEDIKHALTDPTIAEVKLFLSSMGEEDFVKNLFLCLFPAYLNELLDQGSSEEFENYIQKCRLRSLRKI